MTIRLYLAPRAVALAAVVVGLLAAAAPARATTDRDRPCLPCHFFGAHEGAPRIDPAAYDRSAHANEGCISCHDDIENPDIHHEEEDQDLAPVMCGNCHPEQRSIHKTSVHGRGFAENVEPREAAACTDCHGVHDIGRATDSWSSTNPVNLATTCARCHADRERVERQELSSSHVIADYLSGVHARGLDQNPPVVAANCGQCHGTHDIQPSYNPASRVNRANVLATCSQCHAEARDEYSKSVHNRAYTAATSDAVPRDGREWDDVPVCTDCHGGHAISETDNLEFHAQIHTKCARCHGDQKKMARYGLSTKVLTSYLDDFHGATNHLYNGNEQAPGGRVATCSDCHGAHDVESFGPWDKPLVRKRVAEVCRRCHQGVPDRFAEAWLSHDPTFASAPVVMGVKWTYRIMIPLILLGLLGHIATHILTHRKRRANLPHEELHP